MAMLLQGPVPLNAGGDHDVVGVDKQEVQVMRDDYDILVDDLKRRHELRQKMLKEQYGEVFEPKTENKIVQIEPKEDRSAAKLGRRRFLVLRLAPPHPPGYDRWEALKTDLRNTQIWRRDNSASYCSSDTESNPTSEFYDPFWHRPHETDSSKSRTAVSRSTPLFSGNVAMQVFSIKLKRIDVYMDDEDGQALLYGSIRVLDDTDWRRNYLFRRNIDDCMPAKPEDTIPLMGPRRGIYCDHMWCLEFNINATDKARNKGKPICKDVLNMVPATPHYPAGRFLTETFRGKYGAVEMKYAIFDDATEASVKLKVKSGWKEGLHGRIAARIFMQDGSLPEGSCCQEGSVPENEVVLFDSAKFDKHITCDDQNAIELWCSVLVVPKGGSFDLIVKLYDPSEDKEAEPEPEPANYRFYPEKPLSHRHKDRALRKGFAARTDVKGLVFQDVRMKAKVSWSTLYA